MTQRRRAAAARKAMARAERYAEWLAAAEELDEATGLAEWRREDESAHYEARELRAELRRLDGLRESGDVVELLDFLHESLHRYLNDLFEPALYQEAHAGPKHLITRYLDAIEDTIDHLATLEAPGWDVARKLEVVSVAAANLGRSALLLSGGATLGFYHLGVVKGLWQERLLPDVLSGASMGAMIAAGVCSRTDEELDELVATGVRDLEREGLEWRPAGEAWRERTLMRPERLLATIRANCGRYTFREAYERSGRILNISVSPTRTRQKPRILNYRTAPDVWIPSAALASSAVPGLFPPATLLQRGRDGEDQPYVPSERWIDGSFGADLPMMRMSRLHNVNHFIVSQTQPHALPLLHGVRRRGWLGLAVEAGTTLARSQGVPVVALGRRLAARTVLRRPLDVVHDMATQRYRGDIDIHPRFEPLQYRKLVSNPTEADMDHFVREGERATWPRIAVVRDHTRMTRCLARHQRRLAALRERAPA